MPHNPTPEQTLGYVILHEWPNNGGFSVMPRSFFTDREEAENLCKRYQDEETPNSIQSELWESLQNKSYRETFVASQLSTNIGSQIFSMREARGWSQEKLATEVGMVQPRISVLEGGYDNYSLRTLKRFASAFDVAVVVRFVPFSELVNWVTSLAPDQLAPVEFANDNPTIQPHKYHIAILPDDIQGSLEKTNEYKSLLNA